MQSQLPKPQRGVLWKDRFFIASVVFLVVAGILGVISPRGVWGAFVGLILGIGWIWLTWKRPFWIIAFLLVYLPFETVFVRYVPVSGQAPVAARFLNELIVYSTFFIVLSKRIILHKSIRKTPLDIPILLILVVIVVSMFASSASLLAGLINVRTIVRYILLYYTVVNLDLSSRQIALLLRIIIFMGLIQLSIGLLQIITRGAVNPYLLPRSLDLTVVGVSHQYRLLTKGREFGSIFGTLGDTVYFGLFILILLTIYLAKTKKIRLVQISVIFILLVAIGYSYARTVTFASLLLVILFFAVRWGLKKAIYLSLAFLPVFLAVSLLILFNPATGSSEYYNPVLYEQSIFQNITGVFSKNYVENAKKQRLGALLGIAPTILANRPLLGFGPDMTTTVAQLNESQPNYLLGPLLINGFEDVYWVAILAYYGLAGVAAFVYLFYRLGSSAYKIYKKTQEDLTRTLALTVFYLAVITPCLLFFSQVLEFRIFAALFWLFPALLYRQHNLEMLRRQSAQLDGV